MDYPVLVSNFSIFDIKIMAFIVNMYRALDSNKQ